MNLKEHKISSEKIYDGIIVKLSRDTVKLPNEKEAFREVIRHPGAVCVVPIKSNGDVVLVRQYRYPFSCELLEVPAGKLSLSGDAPEDPCLAAARELEEETGFTASRLEYMGCFLSSPAILDEKIYMYIATGLTPGKMHPDDDEFVEPLCINLGEAVDMVLAGKIPDGKTQAALLRAWFMHRS